MKAFENVYKLENGMLIENTENKLEYTDNAGKRRVKTNPSLADFAGVGKFPLSSDAKKALETGKEVKFFVKNDEIHATEEEVIK